MTGRSIVAMRFGLVGTGYWAETTHAPALATTPGARLASVWGRDPQGGAGVGGPAGGAGPAGGRGAGRPARRDRLRRLRRVPRQRGRGRVLGPAGRAGTARDPRGRGGQAPAAREAGRAVGRGRRRGRHRRREGRGRLGRVLHLAVQPRDPRLAGR